MISIRQKSVPHHMSLIKVQLPVCSGLLVALMLTSAENEPAYLKITAGALAAAAFFLTLAFAALIEHEHSGSKRMENTASFAVVSGHLLFLVAFMAMTARLVF